MAIGGDLSTTFVIRVVRGFSSSETFSNVLSVAQYAVASGRDIFPLQYTQHNLNVILLICGTDD